MYRIIGADGKEYGPVPAEVVRQWLDQGRANAQTRVLPEGASEWKTLGQLPEFSIASDDATPEPIRPLNVTPPAPGNSLAVVGFILGIISIPFSICCYGLPFNVAGLAVSFHMNLPSGATIVLFSGCAYFVSLATKALQRSLKVTSS